jgi:hypothetical protein
MFLATPPPETLADAAPVIADVSATASADLEAIAAPVKARVAAA